MNFKVSTFLSKQEEDGLIIFPKGVTYVEKESIFPFKKRVKTIRINLEGHNKDEKKR